MARRALNLMRYAGESLSDDRTLMSYSQFENLEQAIDAFELTVV